MALVSIVCLMALGIPGGAHASRGVGHRNVCPPRPSARSKARKLAGTWYKRGIRLYKQKSFRAAHQAFVCTSHILDAGLTQYWIARSAQDAGMLREALTIFEKLRRKPPAPVTRREIEERIATLQAGLSARRENVDQSGGRKAGKGEQGKQAVGNQGVVGAGKTRVRRYETVAWALWGTGAGLLVTAVVLGTVAGLDQRALENAGDGTWWTPDLDRRYSRRNGLLGGTYAFLGAGVMAVAAGTALYFLGRPTRSEKVSFQFSSRGAGLRLSLDW